MSGIESARGGFMKIGTVEVDAFTFAYVECALWSSTDNATDDGGNPLDVNYSLDDIAPKTLARMIEDCKAFQQDNEADLTAGTAEQGGHDFWLTRNHHGAGFWDGDWPTAEGKALTEAADAYGEFNLYVGDDGRIHD